MNTTLMIHSSSKKEKENILSLFRIPLTYFSKASIPQNKEKQSLKVKIDTELSTPAKMQGTLTTKNGSYEENITISVPSMNEELPENITIEPIPSSQGTEDTFSSMHNSATSPTPASSISNTSETSQSTNSPTISTENFQKNSENPAAQTASQKTESNQQNIPPGSSEVQQNTTAPTLPESQPQHSTSPLSSTENTDSFLKSNKLPPVTENTQSNSQNSSNTKNSEISNNKSSNDLTKKNDGDNKSNNNLSEKNSDEPNKHSDNDSIAKNNGITNNKSTNDPTKKNASSTSNKSENDSTKKDDATNNKSENSSTKKDDATNKPNDDTKETLDKAREMQKKSPTDKPTTEPKQGSLLDKARDMKKKNVDGIKDKAKNMVPQKVRDAANGVMDKAQGALGKAAPALNALKSADKLANGSNDEKAEAVGDLATKGASAALKASGVGAGVGAAIDAADKVLGNTELGKAAKKTCGYCVTCSCCASVLLLLLPIFLFVSSVASIWGWIFGMKATSDEIDKTDLETAITEDLLFEETRYGDTTLFMILEERLKDEYYGFKRIVYNDDCTIKYDENGSQVFESISHVPKFCEEYVDNDLAPQGQFSTAYEVLMSNYTVAMIKEPRHDSGMSAEHMPLFQNILEENFETLREQFYHSQVPDEFWNDLYDMLNTTYNPYNPITGAYIDNVSLRDLLLETSNTTGDAYYDTYTVDAIINYTEDPNNQNLAREFHLLQESLTRIEVMTYMMAIRNFYDQKDDFLHTMESVKSYGGKPAENYPFFAENNGAFFDQFLLIPDVESYMALSATTVKPAFAYDIAVASLDVFRESNAPWKEFNGKVYYFFESVKTWAATYTFYNSISPEGEYTIVCTDIKSSKLEENLYKRYEITDPEGFFNFFESATGIEISTTDDTSTFFLVANMLPQETETSFPLAARTSITHAYEQEYSQETIDKFGLIGDNGKHTGVDFSAKIGTEVLAIKDGTVGKIYTDNPNRGWGYYMTVNHSGGYTSLYAHGNGVFLVSEGQSVTAGTPIMESGNSGNSTGPHLHLQVYTGGSPSSHVNPIKYINGTLYESSDT